MSDSIQNQPDTPTETHATEPVDTSRRKLAGSALGVAAVFTLASQPVLATGGGVCKSPSGAMSGNLSQHGAPVTCSGRSPGYWKEHSDEWIGYAAGSCSSHPCNQAQNWSGGTLFHPLFAGSIFMANLDGNPNTPNTSLSMMQVLHLNNGSNPWGINDPDNLGAHIVAALLNAVSGKTPVLSDTAVLNIWLEWAANGYFEPTANTRWYSAQIVAYIQGTFLQ